jgi:hypothetical protein
LLDFRSGSIATELGFPRHVWFTLDSGQNAAYLCVQYETTIETMIIASANSIQF